MCWYNYSCLYLTFAHEKTVAIINSMNDIAFVVLTGDITELGTDAEIKLAKDILSELKVPYYIIAGNHDTGWSFGELDGNGTMAQCNVTCEVLRKV